VRSLVGLVIVAAVITGSAPPTTAESASLPLRRIADVRLPGKPTRFDYQSVDPGARRLYLAHLGDNSVVVVNLDSLRPLAEIHDIASAHGVLAVPDLDRAFATATGTSQLVAIDTRTDRIVGRTRTGSFPDGLAYDPDDVLILVSNKNAGSVSVIDARTGNPVRTVELGAEVGNVAYDTTTHRAWVAARPPDELVAFDPATGTVAERIRLPGCDGAHGVYLQPDVQRAYVACERNARVVVVDLHRGRVLERLRVGRDPDVLAFDPNKHRLYVAAESGIVTVVATAGQPRVLARGELHATAHSVAVDPRTGHVLFPLESVNGHPVVRVMQPSD
jgi:DNA-binding beta-propeller fold protein YncE